MGSFKHQKNTLPAPRPAVNQGIDKQNAVVLNHTAIYEHSLSQIAESNTVQNALIILNPFTTAPLSAWAGIWSAGTRRLTLRIEDVAQTALPVVQNVTLAAGQTCYRYWGWWLIPTTALRFRKTAWRWQATSLPPSLCQPPIPPRYSWGFLSLA